MDVDDLVDDDHDSKAGEVQVQATIDEPVSTMEDIVEDEMKHLSKRAKRRIERIQIQKEKKKAKKAVKREEREKMMLENPRNVCPRARGPDPDPIIAEKHRQRNRALKDQVRNQIIEDAKEGPIVVFDMSAEWELAMNVAERASLAQQLMFSYGSNKRCIKPARLLTTGLPVGGVVDKSLHKHAGKQNWLAFDFSYKPLEDHLDAMRKYGENLERVLEHNISLNESSTDTLSKASNQKAGRAEEEGINDNKGAAEDISKEVKAPFQERECEIYYLTADTDNVLEEVPWNNDTIYVIGAIVDRNRMTKAAVLRAEQLGIKPVCLPLEKYCDLAASTKVLTVNHCVELLERRGCGESWESAFENTLPSRKEVIVKKKASPTTDTATSSTAGSAGADDVASTTAAAAVPDDATVATVGEEGDAKKGELIEKKIDPTFSRDIHIL